MRRNLLPEDPHCIEKYNKKIRELISKKVKENWMKQEISKLEEMIVDPFKAWQATKRILLGLSHNYINTKNKYTKLKKSMLELNTSIADPISLEELKDSLKIAKNRMSPGSNGIPIELYKHLDNENLTKVLNILNCYVQDPNYDIPD